jgi:hypothetical protein
MAAFICGIFQSGSVHLSKIARKMPSWNPLVERILFVGVTTLVLF